MFSFLCYQKSLFFNKTERPNIIFKQNKSFFSVFFACFRQSSPRGNPLGTPLGQSIVTPTSSTGRSQNSPIITITAFDNNNNVSSVVVTENSSVIINDSISVPPFLPPSEDLIYAAKLGRVKVHEPLRSWTHEQTLKVNFFSRGHRPQARVTDIFKLSPHKKRDANIIEQVKKNLSIIEVIKERVSQEQALRSRNRLFGVSHTPQQRGDIDNGDFD